MSSILKSGLVAGVAFAGLMSLSTAVFADETTTTTTTTHTAPAPGLVVGVPGVVGVQIGGHPEGGCETRKRTETNDSGDTATQTQTRCH